jgi:tRNA-specific 2-thiouridylase
VAVALSGGVDSAVAAALLRARGYRVQGLHLRLHEACPPRAQLSALARHLGIPLAEVDLREEFAREVIDYFLTEYTQGRTPNPCVHCNAAIKFGRLWEWARAAGATHLATGHYVRLHPAPDGALGLFRARDRTKEQSYFLNRLPRELLPHLLFPLGDLTKKEVEARARDLGLPLFPSCRDSQEVCFIPEGRYTEFIRHRRGSAGEPGELVDRQGRVRGRHQGLEGFTVGQRRGLGVPDREPYFVLEIQPATRRVIIGKRAELLAPGLRAGEVNWLITPPVGELEATAVIRYRHPGVRARIIPAGPTDAEVVFATPQAAVAPGQAVAFYQDDQLLGGGWIEGSVGD